ncbi:effector-associated domain 2-containing protein [Actinomadura xylanilytica]|uniref:effector-associated domain 2-containing protein n=1 Tax=Actinomadura xylanilytica TaxID=887459 RepID=UPI00255B12CE|nr:hypothetical protein [Actinomadura xylanilytica]MDL4771784.1 hypothetical protein [Actinomadura xylanilytica]
MDKDAEDGRNGWAPSGQCTVFACDIISFASRPDSVQRHLRTVLYDLLERSFTASGLPFSEFHREDRGDGLIAVLRPGHDGARLVHPLPDHLRAELRRSNELAKEIAQIRLRVALHLGRMDSDANGIVGDTVNHVSRLLDAPSFKLALAGTADVLGVLASDEFYRSVIKEGDGAIDPTEYGPLDVRLKETRTTAWLSIRGAARDRRPAPGPGPQSQPPPDPEPERSPDPPPEPGGTLSPSPAGFAAPSAPPGMPSGTPRGPSQDDPATPRPVGPALPAVFEIVARLMDISLMTSPEGRQQVIASLRPEIAVRIPRRPQPHLDAHSIVSTCLEFQDGLEEFLAIVRAYAGDSAQMRALDATIARLTGGPS